MRPSRTVWQSMPQALCRKSNIAELCCHASCCCCYTLARRMQNVCLSLQHEPAVCLHALLSLCLLQVQHCDKATRRICRLTPAARQRAKHAQLHVPAVCCRRQLSLVDRNTLRLQHHTLPPKSRIAHMPAMHASSACLHARTYCTVQPEGFAQRCCRLQANCCPHACAEMGARTPLPASPNALAVSAMPQLLRPRCACRMQRSCASLSNSCLGCMHGMQCCPERCLLLQSTQPPQ